MPSTSLSMPGLRLGKRQRGAVRGQCCLQTPSTPPMAVPGVFLSCNMGNALGFKQERKTEEQRGGHSGEAIEQLLEAPSKQRDPGALNNFGTGKLHLSYGMERWLCDRATKSPHFPAG